MEEVGRWPPEELSWDNEDDIVHLVEFMCRHLGQPQPKVIFTNRLRGYCDHKQGTIELPHLGRVIEYMALSGPIWYRELALHELAHWFMGPEPGHSPGFYALLYCLCEIDGIPTDLVLEGEREYKKRNAPKGYELYLRIKQGGLSTGENARACLPPSPTPAS